MNCGCEYTAFPQFDRCTKYSRYDHSLGVGLIVWHFTQSPVQALAGLFHDVATPAFSHVVDFLRGDHLTQESTEDGTTELIDGSPEIRGVLRSLGLKTADVCDYHRYPVADNDAPRLSADRLEYTLGNLVQFGFSDLQTMQTLYDDLFVGKNEDGAPELTFRTASKALAFAEGALCCSKVYVSDEDRYAMQMLAELLGDAIRKGILTERDLYTTEPEVLTRLKADEEFAHRWEVYCGYREILTAERPGEDGDWRVIPAKKRRIDPLIMHAGRASACSLAFREQLLKFQQSPQDYWVCGR
ncbi:MAG: hypothetical protein IJJ99_06030 [Oscillospiraceae bacterium]|nr:hypothetical protein [Oscillospiraceae bacterium]